MMKRAFLICKTLFRKELFSCYEDFLSEELDILIQNLILYNEASDNHDKQTLERLLGEGAACKAETEF